MPWSADLAAVAEVPGLVGWKGSSCGKLLGKVREEAHKLGWGGFWISVDQCDA
jgi:hypothetical protein